MKKSLGLSVDSTYSLGKKDKRFRQGYFSGMVSIQHNSSDYGGDFLTYVPPKTEVRNGAMLTAEDTNETGSGHRIFVYSGGAWRYMNLSTF